MPMPKDHRPVWTRPAFRGKNGIRRLRAVLERIERLREAEILEPVNTPPREWFA
tara:strand:+ start:6655 stop:6816 length:162 start_codon:yes stop_codon:yes gene_type:complete